MSSRDVVNIVYGVVNAGRSRKQRIKVGHTGTLDPLASGVLVVAIGSATRLSYLIGDMDKRYQGTFRLNESSDSGDLDGQIQTHDFSLPTLQRLRAAASQHVGEIQQVPPAHSAIHIDGIKAYKRVRAGETVTMPSRTVRIDAIDVTRFEPPQFDIDVCCGGGTYMRTLGKDIAVSAGNIAVMTGLVRTQVGAFTIDDAIDDISLKRGDWFDRVEPLVRAAADLPRMVLDSQQERLIDDGCPIAASMDSQTQIAAVNDQGDLRAILVRKNDTLKCHRVFASALRS